MSIELEADWVELRAAGRVVPVTLEQLVVASQVTATIGALRLRSGQAGGMTSRRARRLVRLEGL